ncbi:MAG: replication-relaxation family protein [Micromonosporaceae bacterium]|nr:replication-relaxation family protein [Micromonosporaceae bacterium]
MRQPRPPRHPPLGDPPGPQPTSLDILAVQSRLTNRDRTIIEWLDQHGVLTTAQLAAAFFTSPITASHRLATLHTMGVVDRFHRPTPTGGFGPWHWVIGSLGARIAAAGRDTKPPTPRVLRARHDKLTDSPTLPHRLGANQFFIDLHVHTRRHPDTRLVRWWSEHDTARRYHGRIHPDGHALWRDRDVVIGIFVEYDRGTEDLWRLVRKLAAYDQIAAEGGACYPVLFWLPSRSREANLHAEFARRRPTGPVPVATAVCDPTGPGPGGRVWALIAAPEPRQRLAELPFDHGDLFQLAPNLNDPALDHELESGSGSQQ